MPFASPSDAEDWFEDALRMRGAKSIQRDTIKEVVKGGRFAYPKLYTCDATEAYLLIFWRSRDDQIKRTAQVSNKGSALDERLKFASNTFGEGLVQTTQVKETTLLKLLEIAESGIESYLVTAYSNGDVFFANARAFYQFATRYGTYLQFSRDPNMMQSLPYRVPTSWMTPWTQKEIKVGYPTVKD